MKLRRVVSCALIAGIPFAAVRRVSPGMAMDLFLYRQDYDLNMHGMKRKKAGE